MNMQKNSWENEEFENAEFSLIIRGNLNIEKLNEDLKLKSPTIIKKGDIISKVAGKSQEDVYIYSKKYENISMAVEHLDDFLTELYNVKEIIRNLTEIHNISLRIYIQSSQAQISFSMKKETILKLAEMKLPIDFSVISWGGVV